MNSPPQISQISPPQIQEKGCQLSPGSEILDDTGLPV